ncbi:hypothetical protein [Streptomyces sp. YS-3]
MGRAPAVLVRPDGHAVWIAAPSTPAAEAAQELRRSLTRWFGRPRATM